MFQGNFEGQLALLAGADLRSRLTDQLVRGHSECMVCLERVKQHHNTWDCHNCFQVCIHEKLSTLLPKMSCPFVEYTYDNYSWAYNGT